MEALEDRLLFSMNPTGMEQQMLEMINRFRANPTEELGQIFISTNPGDANFFRTHDADVNAALDFFGVNATTLFSQFTNLQPSAPLAWNDALQAAATTHSNLMISLDTQAHVLPGEAGLLDRIENAGYNWTGSVSVSENVFAFTENVFHGHAAFVIDWGATPTGIQDPAGHRDNLLNPQTKEVGISIIAENNPGTSVGPLVVTQDFGTRGNYGDARALGVAFTDADGDGFYDAGEGLGGLTITIANGVNTYTATTMTAGGYQVAVAPGTYNVTASGGSLSNTVFMGTIVVGSANVKLDLNTSNLPPTGTIAGRVFSDLDQNGIMAGNEAGLAGWTVFVDQNGDGLLNAGERSATTASNGQYSIFDVTPGSANVRVVNQAIYRATSPALQSVNVIAGGVSSNVNFGQFQWITVNGSQATIVGTNGNDTFSYTAGNASFQLNGVTTNLAPNINALTFDGIGGNNQLTVTGSSGNDAVVVQDKQLSVTGTGYSVTGKQFATFEVYNGGLAGTDRADLYDTSAADEFWAYPGMSMLKGGGVTTRVHGFDVVYAYSVMGGADVAHLYDGIGSDVFVSSSTHAFLKNSGGGFFYLAYKFPTVHGYATAGGRDVATLYDSAGNDRFTATPANASLTDGSSYSFDLQGFEEYYAISTLGGTDEAYLYDGPTDDIFNGRPEFGALRDKAWSFYAFAGGYDRVMAFAHAGGNDQANLYDGAGNDQYVGRPEYALLKGNQNEFYNYAEGFKQTFAYSAAGGQDFANLYDSSAADAFTAYSQYAFMQSLSGSYYNNVNGFRQVLAFSTAGGADTANLFDSASDDVFTGQPTYAVMRNQANTYYNYAKGFSRVNAFSQNGGSDVANLFGSTDDDRFVASPTYAFMKGLNGGYFNYTTGFKNVYGTAGAAGVNYATLYDSNGNDIFTARTTYAELQNAAASYYLRVNGFQGVYAYASAGVDVAHLYDSTSADTATGRSNYMLMTGANVSNRAAGFDTVNIYGFNGGTNVLDAQSIDYILQVLGSWQT